ncbi:hypothetical protein CRJUMX02_1880023 [Escherichia coli]|nr:hypothetical protein CRJUMX02_1880023 [Escherichia coli]
MLTLGQKFEYSIPHGKYQRGWSKKNYLYGFQNKIQVHKSIDYCIGVVGINNDDVKVKISIQDGNDSKNSERTTN